MVNFMMKNKNIISIYLITLLLFCVYHGECSVILCNDPTADNYNESSECGCKYSDLFEGQGNSVCPSEISFLVYQEWMGNDFCFSFQNGNQYWTKAKYDEFMTNLANIYNLSNYVFYENDNCDRTPGEYYSTRYAEPYENGDCKIDSTNLFQYPPFPWDGTFVSDVDPCDLYWHIIGFMVRTEDATVPFSCCNEMFDSDDWTKFVTSPCGSYGDSDGDGICNDGDNNLVAGNNPCTGGDTTDCDDNCPDDANPLQEDVDDDTLGDVCDNCPNTPNSLQEDTYPPQQNGIGDACECEGNFDNDQDQDGTDAATFKADFGRSPFSRPCTSVDSCNGDFDCDVDVDGTDAAKFKEDFGRSPFFNPCPICPTAPWCTYP